MSNRLLVLALGLGLLAVSGCDLDVPDLNNPGIDQLQVAPTPPSVNAASTGLLVGIRSGKAGTTGLVNQLGILGRESYDFDPNDSRFVTELIQGNLQRASPFGGIFWAVNFNNIRLGYLIIDALDKIDPSLMGDADKLSMKGFAHTMMALDFLTVILTHNDTGAPIDVDRPPGSKDLAPFVPKDKVYDEIVRLLEMGYSELRMSLPTMKPESATFTFPLSPGFQTFGTFNTPLTFIQFNRAIRARVAVYTKDYATALNIFQQTTSPDPQQKSFLIDDPTAKGFDFNLGVYYSYSLNTGDATNGLISKPIFAHPALQTDAQLRPMQMDGTTPPDDRYARKVRDRTSSDPPSSTSIDPSLTTTIKFKMYTNITPLALIRNEDLILLESEALWFGNPSDPAKRSLALDKLDVVRTVSGKLAPIDRSKITDDKSFTNALLYERRYSLLFEGGHRWIDRLRFKDQLLAPGEDIKHLLLDPKENTSHTANIRYPVPQSECDARPSEPACMLDSSTPVSN